METKEREFGGTVLNGFLFLFVNIVLTLASLAGIIYGIMLLAADSYGGINSSAVYLNPNSMKKTDD